MNLGYALKTLGERETGMEHLQQAVDALRLALQENTRERVPLEWARTQMNLGAALATLGRRESGMKHLQQAVDALRLALQENTRERSLPDWAGTQFDLCLVLSELGRRAPKLDPLNEALISSCLGGSMRMKLSRSSPPSGSILYASSLAIDRSGKTLEIGAGNLASSPVASRPPVPS